MDSQAGINNIAVLLQFTEIFIKTLRPPCNKKFKRASETQIISFGRTFFTDSSDPSGEKSTLWGLGVEFCP